MSLINSLEKILDQNWRSFLQSMPCEVGVREIKKGVDYDLMVNLKGSRFFGQKAQNIPKMTPVRDGEWAEARRVELYMEKGFKKYSQLGGTQLLSSISHTRSDSLNVVVGVSCASPTKEKGSIKGVGVDIEFEKRKLPTEFIERFLDPQELTRYSSLLPMDQWVLREAAFKATPQDLQLVVTQYRIEDWNEKTKEGTVSSPQAKCKVKLFSHMGLHVGLAYYRL